MRNLAMAVLNLERLDEAGARFTKHKSEAWQRTSLDIMGAMPSSKSQYGTWAAKGAKKCS